GGVFDGLVEDIEGGGGGVGGGEEVKGKKGRRGEKGGKGSWQISTARGTEEFDRVLVTVPPAVFSKLVPALPAGYSKKLERIKFLGAESLVFVLKKKLTDWYWINICDEKAPFLALVEHTNFANPADYGGKTVVYLGNYLDPTESRFKLAEEKVAGEGIAFLKKFNKQFDSSWVEETFLFRDEFAQPVVTVGYKELIPEMTTPLDGLFYANFCQIYPWDRGMDQSVALGKKAGQLLGAHEEPPPNRRGTLRFSDNFIFRISMRKRRSHGRFIIAVNLELR
ncbi:hypothetical protein L6258_03795, partial [Candidatus Parcubacteria bacterium]|nr:hypothetical protein [Candidatus Parcubacteria bacterium]